MFYPVNTSLNVRFKPLAVKVGPGCAYECTPMIATCGPAPGALTEFEAGQRFLASRDIQTALKHLFRAEAAGYSADQCAAGRWFCRMLLGDFESAWQESDEIAMRTPAEPHRLWDGKEFAGKDVVIRCLHGFGDAIQFVRYARLIRSTASSVTVETHPELVSLFSSLTYIDRVVTWADGSSKCFTGWNQQVEVMELPWVFRTTVATIPAEVPYLFVSPDNQRKSLSSLHELSPNAKVGIVWRSSDWNPERSVPVSILALLLDVPCLSFYSFQYLPTSAELSTLRQYGSVHDISARSPQISETAANLVNMDLLITVDTMCAHLAGALGKQVWTMLPFEADWRWMLDTSWTPWYPTMTLFRQSRPGDWQGVMQQIAGRLRSFNKSPSQVRHN